VDRITVLLVEPDPTLRAYFERVLAFEADLLVISQHHFPFVTCDPPTVCPCDVLLLDADTTPVTDHRTWARIHLLFPGTNVVVITAGHDDVILEAVLAGGITGVHRPTTEPAILCRALRHSAHGILDSDRELIDRAKRVLLQPLAETQVRFGGLTIDLQARKVNRWNKAIHLTPLEFKVLANLVQHRDRPTSLNELLADVWSASPEMGGTLAQVHCCIQRLRQKIEPDPRHPRYLLSERGWGYWLQDPTAMATTHLPAQFPPQEKELLPELIDN
jgi:DNA-binding winged helix-turn-helix (wHTH) protein